MEKKIIVANWKMNGSKALCDRMCKELHSNHQIIICPPFVYIDHLHGTIKQLNLSNVTVGAQDCSGITENGAYTGDISCSMLSEFDVHYVIVGHSERRRYHDESLETILAKINACVMSNITPILCVGYAHKYDDTMVAIENEMDFIMSRISNASQKVIIAYEPVSAIGSGIVPSNQHIQQVMDIIKQYSKTILYGGSVNSSNIQHIMHIEGLSGVLVGGASLEPDSFFNLLKMVA